MARYITPYLQLVFSFTETADPQPIITTWNCDMTTDVDEYGDTILGFEKTIKYVYDGNYCEEHLTIVHGPNETLSGENIWPYARILYDMKTYSEPGVYDQTINLVGKCKIDSNGNLDIDTFEYVGVQTPDEDTTFTSTKLTYKPRFIIPDAVWAYDSDYGDWYWFVGDDALALTQTGGGRYNDRVIFLGYDSNGNGAIYFS